MEFTNEQKKKIKEIYIDSLFTYEEEYYNIFERFDDEEKKEVLGEDK